jgi:2-keto-4-pentenoate hydratase/2-oxohepta-3-ene-1,7-dioic acid hydratase in catechol pathway
MLNIIEDFASIRDELQELEEDGRGVPAGSVQLRAPIPRPRKLICCFGNYREGQERPAFPIDMFLKSQEGVIGPGDTIVLPRTPFTICHHEAELGVVIGKRVKDLSREETMDAVFGYTAFMDVSPRAGIGRNPGMTMIQKSYDTCAPMGPCIVTADEIRDPHKLQIRYWVDDQPRHDYNTSDLEHTIPEIIEWATMVMTLLPGDVIALGTNHQGIGPLQDGETGTIEIEKIGRFSVKVLDPLKRSWPKQIDQDMARRVREARPPAAPAGR